MAARANTPPYIGQQICSIVTAKKMILSLKAMEGSDFQELLEISQKNLRIVSTFVKNLPKFLVEFCYLVNGSGEEELEKEEAEDWWLLDKSTENRTFLSDRCRKEGFNFL
jgi:hypothetical protein